MVTGLLRRKMRMRIFPILIRQSFPAEFSLFNSRNANTFSRMKLGTRTRKVLAVLTQPDCRKGGARIAFS